MKMISVPKDPSAIDADRSDGYDEASIRRKYDACLHDMISEYNLMQQLQGNSNIVDCKDIYYERQGNGIGWNVYIRMELLTPLKDLTNAGDLPEKTVIELGKDICRALAACQERNIVHRDIKPENIMASSFGFKLGDFGIARTLDHTTNASLTGTERYIAPEVVKREKYGREVDIYSLGLVLYWLLNNRRMPFWPQGNTPPRASEIADAQTKRIHGEPLPAPVHGSPALKQIVLKACAYKPKDRYSSAKEMLTALEGLTGGTVPKAAHSAAAASAGGSSGSGTIGGEYGRNSIGSDPAADRIFESGSESTAGNGWENGETIGAPARRKQLKEIAVGIDLAGSKLELSYLKEAKKSVGIRNYRFSEEKWRIDANRGWDSFADVLKYISSDLESKGIGKIRYAAFAVPASLSYLQKKALVQTAKSVGIRDVSLGRAGVYASMSKIILDHSDRTEQRFDIVCNLQDRYFEISAIEVQDISPPSVSPGTTGAYLSRGTTGIQCEDGWNNISQADFQKRIESEVQQFFKDNDYILKPGHEVRVFMIGDHNGYIEELLQKKTGKAIEKNQLDTSMGALMWSLGWSGVNVYSDYEYLCFSSFDRNIWVGLGDLGEKAIVVNRYTGIFTRKSVKLLLSTETHLRVYEGNYFNPKFDCLLADIPLDSVKAVEGKEIECEVDIDVFERITITVYDHEKKKLLSRIL